MVEVTDTQPSDNVATGMALAAMPLVAPIQDVHVDDMVKAYRHVEVEYQNPDIAKASIGGDDNLSASTNEDEIYMPRWQE